MQVVQGMRGIMVVQQQGVCHKERRSTRIGVPQEKACWFYLLRSQPVCNEPARGADRMLQLVKEADTTTAARTAASVGVLSLLSFSFTCICGCCCCL